MNYSVNLPKQLQQEAEQWAATQGVPLDQFILWAVAEKVTSLRQELHDPNFPNVGYRQGASGLPVAVVKGTGVRIQTLAVAARQWELSTEQIMEEYGLTAAQVRDALGFYAAHPLEFDAAIQAEEAAEAASG